MTVRTAVDHIRWLVLPSRFLFSPRRPRRYRVAGREVVRFVDSQEEVQAVNHGTGDVCLGGAGNQFLQSLLGAQSLLLRDHERHRLARWITRGALSRCTRAGYTALWGIHLSGLSCWHASFKARGRVRSMDSVDPSASQPRDGLHPVLEVRLAHAPHYKDLIARSHPAGPAISATATAGPRWNRKTWIPSANRPWLEIRVTPVKWIPPTALFDQYIDDGLDEASSRWVTGLGRWSRAVTMRAMCHIVLDIRDQEAARPIFRRFEAITGMWQPRGAFFLGTIAALVARRLDGVVYDTIAERRRQGAVGESPLDALIRGQEEHGYDDQFIRDNVVALLATGCEATGAAIAWMLYWLAQSDAYARLRARREAGDTAFLVAFRNECLRFSPPVEILPPEVASERREAAGGSLPDRCLDPSCRPTECLPFGMGPRFRLGASVGLRLMDGVLDRLLARDLRFEMGSRAFRPMRRNAAVWPGPFLFGRLSQNRRMSC